MSRQRSREDSSTAWLWMLKDELSLIDEHEIEDPDSEMNTEREEVLGEASMEIRKLWTYYLRAEERSTRLGVEAQYERNDPEKREQLRKESLQLRIKAETVQRIVWVSLRDQFNLWNPGLGMAIRSGWVVTSFESGNNFITDILKGMMGGP